MVHPEWSPSGSLPAGQSGFCTNCPPCPISASWIFTSRNKVGTSSWSLERAKLKEWALKKGLRTLLQAGNFWFSETEDAEAGDDKSWGKETKAAGPLLQKFYPSPWSSSWSPWPFSGKTMLSVWVSHYRKIIEFQVFFLTKNFSCYLTIYLLSLNCWRKKGAHFIAI